MNYQQSELTEARKELKKRRTLVYIPVGLLIGCAIAAFILCRQARMESGWLIVSGFVVAAGAVFIFFYDVYIKPVKLYARHIDTMLNGRLRETAGVIKEISPDLCDKDGLRCYTVWLNVGDKGLEEDDRLFYLVSHKPIPNIAVGTKVTVMSNDKMISSIAAD